MSARRAILITAGLVTVAAVGVGAYIGVDRYFADRALPGTVLAGTDVGGMTSAQIADVVKAGTQSIAVQFIDDKTTVTGQAGQIGLSVDTQATIDRALQAKRSQPLWNRLNPSRSESVDLVLTSDTSALQTFLDESFPTAIVQPTDAKVAFSTDSGTFETTPGKAGRRIDAGAYEAKLAALAAAPRSMELKVALAEVRPAVDDDAAETASQALNDGIAQPLRVMNGKTVVATAQPATVGSWITATANPDTGKFDVAVNTKKIQAWVTDNVAPAVHVDAVTERLIVDINGNTVRTVQKGVEGKDLTGAKKLASGLAAAAKKGQAADVAVQLKSTPFDTEKELNRWAKVTLSTQTVTLYENDKVVKTFTISSGTAAHPTPTGTFRVFLKTEVQSMKGGDAADGTAYDVPNVKWNSFFNGGVAFHTAYWHNNFGHPMSHGCINMREADAKYVYDFAPVGTKVVVVN